VEAPSAYDYEFTAWDGYSKDGIGWDKVAQAYLLVESGALQFPPEAEMESGYYVNGVVSVALTAATSYELTVNWDGNSVVVDLYDIPVNDDAIPSVDMVDLLETAGVTAPDGYSYTFTAADGFAKEDVEWDLVQLAWLNQASGDLQYPAELELSGSYFVTGVVTIDLTAL